MTIENPRILTLQVATQECVNFRRGRFFKIKQKILHDFVKDALARLPKEKVGEVRDAFDRAKFEFHHIVPLSLGGTNELYNLALVEMDFHERIHKTINAGPKPLPGTTVQVSIPIYPGKIWYDALEIFQRRNRPNFYLWQRSRVNSSTGLQIRI